MGDSVVTCDDCVETELNSGSGLRVHLRPLDEGSDQIEYRSRNDGQSTTRVLLREIPIAGVGNAFDVRHDGQPIRYSGPYVSWAEPTAGDFVELEPGGELSAVIELATLYDMRQPGRYEVRLHQLAGPALSEPVERTGSALAEGEPMIAFSLDAADVTEFADPEDDGSVPKAIFGSDSACLGPQQRSVQAAESLADQYLTSIKNTEAVLEAFSTPEASQIFSNHFAHQTFDDMQFVFGTYRGIQRHLVDTDYFCRTDDHPDCSGRFEGALAVTRGPTNVVRLCPAFFDQAIRGQAQTIVHELSHQNRTSPSGIGTDDLVGPSIHNAEQYGRYSPLCFEGTCFPI